MVCASWNGARVIAMGEAVWTLIGLLAASVFGNLYWLGAKIDRLGARLDGRIDAQTARIDEMVARMSAHERQHNA